MRSASGKRHSALVLHTNPSKLHTYQWGWQVMANKSKTVIPRKKKIIFNNFLQVWHMSIIMPWRFVVKLRLRFNGFRSGGGL